ncbi:MAG: hypothetical protein KKH72_03920 [Alphaproteobacteria bacterium]|nr:hypothetical protein [Alphaproteobacteria bacterium]
MRLDPPAAAPKRVLFVANGNGEDSMAAEIVRRLPEGFAPEAYPVVGDGRAYDGLCPIVGPRANVPSEGWRHAKGSVARDLRGGMLMGVPPAVRFLKRRRGAQDKVVAVGDMVVPVLCLLAGLKIDIYLDVFKSGHSHRYSAAEKWVLGRVARKTFNRDDMLAASLRRVGMDAVSAGNVMLDTVPRGSYDMASRRAHPFAVTLMPGSREWTGDSLGLQVAALERLPKDLVPDVFLALAGGLDPARLAKETGLAFAPPETGAPGDAGTLSGTGLVLHLARGVAGNLIEGSDLVLSQAGTGTQQALGLGKPVITFDRAGNRRKRMRDEQALMGEARRLMPEDADAVAAEMARLLRDPVLRARLGEIGKQRLGGPGTIPAVIAELRK